MVVVIVLVALIIALVAANIRIVPQAHSFVIERLGAYKETWDVGLHIKVPFIDRVARQVDLKEQYCDFPPQPVITQDNVTMQIDSIVFFRISDPKAYAYGVRNPIGAIENLTATTLRNVIGSLTLDETLTSRDQINAQMQDALDIATDPWGIKITRVELKNINPPEQIRDAMEKQMKVRNSLRLQLQKVKSRVKFFRLKLISRLQSFEQKLKKKRRSRKLKVRLRLSEIFRRLMQMVSACLRKQVQMNQCLLLRALKPLKRLLTDRLQRLLFLPIFRE